MDYKEKYEQALARAKEILDTRCKEGEQGAFHRKDLQDIFSELAESEDERIELLNYLYDVHDDDEERARWIAWLEKQKPTDKVEPKFHNGEWITIKE